jgi:hypothetical protein
MNEGHYPYKYICLEQKYSDIPDQISILLSLKYNLHT